MLIAKDKDLDQERVAFVHGVVGLSDKSAALVNTLNPVWEALKKNGLTPGYTTDFVRDYEKALRKRKAPYALSLLQSTPAQVERRLFKGAYKGVTDVVTEYTWPEPALHVTRLCASLKLTPNMVTTASLFLVYLAFY